MNRNTLQARFEKFAIDVIYVFKDQKIDYTIKPLVSQLIRSATSIGANYQEAQNAISDKDFRNKVYIAKKESQETVYWIKLLYTCEGARPELKNLYSESVQIVKILQSITTKLDNKIKG